MHEFIPFKSGKPTATFQPFPWPGIRVEGSFMDAHPVQEDVEFDIWEAKAMLRDAIAEMHGEEV